MRVAKIERPRPRTHSGSAPFAAVTASEVLTRIWDVLTGSVDGACAYVRHCIRSAQVADPDYSFTCRGRRRPGGHRLHLGLLVAETINGLYKAELIHRRARWRSFEAVEFATLEWVDWFNNRRLSEPIGNIPPAEAEQRYYAMLDEPAMAA